MEEIMEIFSKVPEWCSSSWCFVDESTCPGAAAVAGTAGAGGPAATWFAMRKGAPYPTEWLRSGHAAFGVIIFLRFLLLFLLFHASS